MSSGAQGSVLGLLSHHSMAPVCCPSSQVIPGLPFSRAAHLGNAHCTHIQPPPHTPFFPVREWQLCSVLCSVQNLHPSIFPSHTQLSAEPAASALKTWHRTSDPWPIIRAYITILSLKGYCMAFRPVFRTTLLKIRSDLISLLLRTPMASSTSPEMVHRDLWD